MKRALIFGGGSFEGEFPLIKDDDYIIAADAGYCVLKEHGVSPHITVGDFDSAGFVPDENAVLLPVEKDVTDSHAAADIALKKGCDEICIYGGMGGRPDHTFANFTLIVSLVSYGVGAYCVGDGYTVTAVKDGRITLDGEKGKTVSVFSWSEKSEGVTLKGLKYPLNEAVLTNNFALGVSNSFESKRAEISVKKGILLVMYEN